MLNVLMNAGEYGTALLFFPRASYYSYHLAKRQDTNLYKRAYTNVHTVAITVPRQ